jgi:hypothetical protein
MIVETGSEPANRDRAGDIIQHRRYGGWLECLRSLRPASKLARSLFLAHLSGHLHGPTPHLHSMLKDTNSPSLYAQILGPAFERLPQALQGIHDPRKLKQYAGRCHISRGKGWIVQAIARLAKLPESHDDIPVTVAIEADGARETWTRRFGTHQMRSTMRRRGKSLEERLGPTTLTFDLSAEGESIVWTLQRARLLFLPLPVAWFAGTTAVETITHGRYSFDVRAAMGGIGLLIHYNGWLIEHG